MCTAPGVHGPNGARLLLRESAGPGMVRAMRWPIFSSEAKKKLWRPCREARALGL